MDRRKMHPKNNTKLRFVLFFGVFFSCITPLQHWLFGLTGEETPFGQARGLGGLTLDLARPALQLAAEVPILHNGVNPFGINTFLEQEVEPAKRERQVRLIAKAGFHWVRQEFPWYDIEIHGKGDFEDRRFEPHRPAWDKYDNIVGLAEKHQLELIVRLSSPPDWSRAAGNEQGAFAPPDNFDDFADFAEAVAGRYEGRVRYYQVWNEPNIYPEWGEYPVSPEQYTDLLCRTYRRLKSVDPEIVVLSGALAPTSELTRRNLNDFIFLQRMYAAGAGQCFDILSMQGYGLFSGPTDHRRRPIVINYNRNPYIRDIMVRNGDAGKAIWISEMNWNTAPNGVQDAGAFGQVTEEQQARYAPLAYQRAQQDWPWIGVINFWFFKRATGSERDQAFYYFRMAEPDFTLLPVYRTMLEYAHRKHVMYPGYYQENHWAVQWRGEWRTVREGRAVLGSYREAVGARVTQQSGVSLVEMAGFSFTWHGTDLILITTHDAPTGSLRISIDGEPPSPLPPDAGAPLLALASHLPSGEHTAEILAPDSFAVDGFVVRDAPPVPVVWLILPLVLLFGIVYRNARRAAAPRQPE